MYDIIVVGAGPAGLAAAMYAGRYLLKTLVISEDVGGQMLLAHKVENYPGILSISGPELMQKFREHAEKFDAEIEMARVESIVKTDSGYAVLAGNKRYEGKTVIYTLGSRHRHLGVPGEKELNGHGVSYCATCDGAFFRNKTVAIVGGGNSAFLGATVVSQYASKMYLIHRRDTFRADPVLVKQVEQYKNVELVLNNAVEKIQGEGVVRSVLLQNEHNGSKELALDGIFIEIGSDPAISLATSLGVEVTPENLIVVRPDQRTNLEGFYAAGDVTTGSNNFRQAITSAAEGTIAADAVFSYLKER